MSTKNEMLSDAEYQLIAKKIIYNAYTPKLADHIFTDPIKFGLVVEAVMMADWEWNGKGTKYGYRKQRAIWAIHKILKDMSNTDRKHKINLFSEIEQDEFCGKNQEDFMQEIEQRDYIDNITNKINNSTTLTGNEKRVMIGKIIEDKSIRELSEEFGIRGEAVRQTLKRAITKIGNSLCI